MTVLYRRLISSAIVISLVLLVLWGDYLLGERTGRNGILIAAIVVVACLLGVEELRRLSSARVRIPFWLPQLAMAAAIATCCLPLLWSAYPAECVMGRLGWLGLAGAVAILIPFLVEIARFRHGQHALERIQTVVFFTSYLLLLGFICQLRFALPNAWGIVAILSLMVTVKSSDSFAYLFGRVWGRHKMSPTLSPGKTIEGAVAGFVFGGIGALIVFYPISYWLTGQFAVQSWLAAVVFALVVTAAGILGDLAESLIKRELEHKDSGGLIPGMGGMMDVMDSLLAAAPVVYVLWATGFVGPG